MTIASQLHEQACCSSLGDFAQTELTMLATLLNIHLSEIY